jgi:hypothetical protein
MGTRGRWVTLPVLGDVENQYQQRPEWPQTPIRATEAGEHSWSEATSTDQQGIFAVQPVPNRLRDVSLAWMSATISGQEEANAVVPTELVNLAPGTSFDEYRGRPLTNTRGLRYRWAPPRCTHSPSTRC